MPEINVPELADKIVVLTAASAGKTGGYYMTNINNPVIAALKRRYCAAKGIRQNIPMGDRERVEFELWLFQPSVRKMVEKMVNEAERLQDKAKK